MKDTHGDLIRVSAADERLYLKVKDSVLSTEAHAALTPATARRLARRLLKVADRVEKEARR